MKLNWFLPLAIILLLMTAAPPSSKAASTYKPCSLVTAAELEALIPAKVTNTLDADTTIPDGPFKGEIMSTCNWALGTTYVFVAIIRVRTPEQRAYGPALAQRSLEKLKQQGWTTKPVTADGISCVILTPPAGSRGAPSVGCFRESKSFGLSVSVAGTTALSPQQVKALTDKAAARVP